MHLQGGLISFIGCLERVRGSGRQRGGDGCATNDAKQPKDCSPASGVSVHLLAESLARCCFDGFDLVAHTAIPCRYSIHTMYVKCVVVDRIHVSIYM